MCPGSQQQQLQATTKDGLLQPLLSMLNATEMISLSLSLSPSLPPSLSLSLHFNGHFSGQPGIAGVY